MFWYWYSIYATLQSWTVIKFSRKSECCTSTQISAHNMELWEKNRGASSYCELNVWNCSQMIFMEVGKSVAFLCAFLNFNILANAPPSGFAIALGKHLCTYQNLYITNCIYLKFWPLQMQINSMDISARRAVHVLNLPIEFSKTSSEETDKYYMISFALKIYAMLPFLKL